MGNHATVVHEQRQPGSFTGWFLGRHHGVVGGFIGCLCQQIDESARGVQDDVRAVSYGKWRCIGVMAARQNNCTDSSAAACYDISVLGVSDIPAGGQFDNERIDSNRKNIRLWFAETDMIEVRRQRERLPQTVVGQYLTVRCSRVRVGDDAKGDIATLAFGNKFWDARPHMMT